MVVLRWGRERDSEVRSGLSKSTREEAREELNSPENHDSRSDCEKEEQREKGGEQRREIGRSPILRGA